MNTFIGSIGGRKFIVALVALATVVFGAKFGIDVEKYKDVISWVTSSYLVGQGFADGVNPSGSSFVQATKPTPPPEA